MALQQGQVINNRYRVVRRLGQGGFGAVYLVWDLNLKVQVAAKEGFDTSPASERQFRSEASLLFNLRHPSLPIVHDCFVIPNQGLYLIMDYIAGENLEQKLAQQSGPLPVQQALNWITPICDALDYLHRQTPPVIHRDIKPANIVIRKGDAMSPDGTPYLVDFGISKLYQPGQKTTIGARAYTPGYSPPEQYGSARTDASSDIYALGATLYHLLTGQAPPPSMDVTLGSAPAPAPVRTLNPAVPPHVSEAILQAMQLQREKRWSSAGAFKQALMGTAPWALYAAPMGAAVQPMASPGSQAAYQAPAPQPPQASMSTSSAPANSQPVLPQDTSPDTPGNNNALKIAFWLIVAFFIIMWYLSTR